jgi:hypothetical protein
LLKKLGAHIKSISIKNNDLTNSIIKINVQDSLNYSFKLCELGQFQIYTDKNLLLNVELDQIIDKMNQRISNKSIIDPIIDETSFKLQLIRDCDVEPLRKLNKPRYKLLSLLPNFSITIKNEQIMLILFFIKHLNLYKNYQLYRNLRPNERPKHGTTAKAWWTYAFNSIRILNSQKDLHKNELIRWCRDVIGLKQAYLAIYKQTRLTTSTSTSKPNEIIGEDLINLKNKIESEWSYDRLKCIRRVLFEYFINTIEYKEYLLKLKTEFASTTAANSANRGISVV